MPTSTIPVTLSLRTGELAPVYDTAAEHGGVLHVACGSTGREPV